MLKRDITYQTFNDPPETITETYYFNLTMPEFAALNPDVDPNTKPEDINLLEFVARADDIVLHSYGQKSEDGRNFEKSEEARNKFKSSAAYVALTDELFTSEKGLQEFIRGILPKQLAEGLDKAVAEAQTPAISPPVPPTL